MSTGNNQNSNNNNSNNNNNLARLNSNEVNGSSSNFNEFNGNGNENRNIAFNGGNNFDNQNNFNSYNPSNIRVVITDLEVQRNPKLELYETEGNILDGKLVCINAAGMIGGLRNQRDGSTLFGYRRFNSQNVKKTI